MAEQGHEGIFGGIGSGKSMWGAFKAIEMMKQGKPFTFVDPRGEMYRLFLAWFACTPEGQDWWTQNRHKVRLLNPVSKCGYIYGFNAVGAMESPRNQTIDTVALVANAVTSHIRYQAGYDFGEAARMTEIMEGAIGLLTAEHLTLSELNFLFMPSYEFVPHPGGKGNYKLERLNPMVKGILSRAIHLGTRRFWETDYSFWSPNAKQDWPQSAKNKVSNYLNNERVAYTVCVDGGLDFNEIINEGLWLFVNIPYQWLSDESTAIIGNLIVNRLFYAAMQRADGAPDYRVFLDEARFFRGGDLPRIMETSRPKRFWLTLIGQSFKQLCRTSTGGVDYQLRDTVLSLSRYISAFKSNDLEDTSTLQQMIKPAKGTETVYLDGKTQLMPKNLTDEQNRQVFVDLEPRQVVLYDQQEHRSMRKRTPDVYQPIVDQAKLDFLESDQLQKTGISTKEAQEQIETRYQYWYSVVTRSQAPVAAPVQPPLEEAFEEPL